MLSAAASAALDAVESNDRHAVKLLDAGLVEVGAVQELVASTTDAGRVPPHAALEAFVLGGGDGGREDVPDALAGQRGVRVRPGGEAVRRGELLGAYECWVGTPEELATGVLPSFESCGESYPTWVAETVALTSYSIEFQGGPVRLVGCGVPERHGGLLSYVNDGRYDPLVRELAADTDWASAPLWHETVREALTRPHPRDRAPNASFAEALVDGWPMMFLVATRDVAPAEEVLVDYGPGFWLASIGHQAPVGPDTGSTGLLELFQLEVSRERARCLLGLPLVLS